MPDYKDQNGKRVVLGNLLGQGGEGSVYMVNGDPQSVAKIFFPHKRSYYAAKLPEMVANPPNDQTRTFTPPHISIAWPEKVLFENKQFVGYTMPTIKKAPDIFKLYSPKMRSQAFPNFNWFNLHHVALNLACAVNAYHAAGYVIGDLNSKNVKVHDNTMVTMIDTDSIQVKTSSGQIMRCPVGVPDFTSPELQNTQLDQVDRDIYHDAFALSVMIFLILMEGYHPFTGAPVNNSISVPSPAYQYFISKGIFPYNCTKTYIPPKNAPDYQVLHPEIQALFDRCFKNASAKNRTNRPLPLEWYKTLNKVEKDLVKCKANHYYYSFYGECPWCKRQKSISSISIPIQQPSKPVVPLQQPIKPGNISKPAITRQPHYTPPPSPPPAQTGKKSKKWVIISASAASVLLVGGILISRMGQNNSYSGNAAGISDWSNGLDTQNNSAVALTEIPSQTATDLVCENAPALFFSVGENVVVKTSTSLRGHSSPDLSSDDVIARYRYGDSLSIIGGPVCVQADSTKSYWFWQVQDASGVTSWVAEGDQNIYYLSR